MFKRKQQNLWFVSGECSNVYKNGVRLKYDQLQVASYKVTEMEAKIENSPYGLIDDNKNKERK